MSVQFKSSNSTACLYRSSNLIMYRENQKTEPWQCSNRFSCPSAPSCLSAVTKPLNAALRLFLSLVVCPLEIVLSYYPRLSVMNNWQCLTGVSALAFWTALSPFWWAGGGYPILTFMQCPNIYNMNAKKQGNKLNGVTSTGRGEKIILLYQSVSVSKEPLTFRPLIFHLSGCSAAAHNGGGGEIPAELFHYGFEFLDFWLEVLIRHLFRC